MCYVAKNLFSGLVNLETINFGGNQIKAVDAFLFRGLVKLKNIQFSENHVKIIPSDIFKGKHK